MTPILFLTHFDSLASTSSAIILSILLFISRIHSELDPFKFNSLPIGIFLYGLFGAATHKGFNLKRLIVSEVTGGRKQLNFICSTKLKSRMAHQLAALHLCTKIQDFGVDNFERFSVSIDVGRNISSVVFLNGDRLKEARDNNEPLEVLGEVFESSLLWHDTSSFWRKIETYSLVFKISLARYWSNLQDEWALKDLTPIRFRYKIRDVKNVSAGKLRRLEATVILNYGEAISKELLFRIARQSIRRLQGRLVRYAGIQKQSFSVRCPCYVWVKIFKNDAVLRHLHGVGGGENLLLKAEWTSFWYKYKPLFVRFPTDILGGYRFEYPVRTMEENLAIIQELKKEHKNSERNE